MSAPLIELPETPAERQLLALYDDARALLARDDLSPSVRANVAAALAPLGVAVTGAALRFEHLVDAGV